MFFWKDLAIKIVFLILFLSSADNDDSTINAEHDFERSSATDNNIVSDVKQGKTYTTDSSPETCPSNPLNQCFITLNISSFQLYNLTEDGKEQNLTAVRENVRLFGKLTKLFF